MPLKAKAQQKEMWRDQTQKVAFGQAAALLRGQRAKPVLRTSQDITTKQAGVATEGPIPAARKTSMPAATCQNQERESRQEKLV